MGAPKADGKAALACNRPGSRGGRHCWAFPHRTPMPLRLGRITVQSATWRAAACRDRNPRDQCGRAGEPARHDRLPGGLPRRRPRVQPRAATASDHPASAAAMAATFLRLSSDRPVNEPFVDLILETNWSSGRIVRDYTLLFDPPSLRQSAPRPRRAGPGHRPPSRKRRSAAATGPFGSCTRHAARGRGRRAPPRARHRETAEAKPPSGDGKQVTVQSRRHRRQDRGSEQAGQRLAGPDAGGHAARQPRRLHRRQRQPPEGRRRAGGARPQTQAGARAPGEASQTDHCPEPRLQRIPPSPGRGRCLPPGVGAPDRQARGKVQAQVEDKKAAAPTPDKLTLSKGAVQGKPSPPRTRSPASAPPRKPPPAWPNSTRTSAT